MLRGGRAGNEIVMLLVLPSPISLLIPAPKLTGICPGKIRGALEPEE